MVPAALALLPTQQRPVVVHQSGRGRREALAARYRELGVDADGAASSSTTWPAPTRRPIW